MKTLIVENSDPNAFRSVLETALNEAMVGQIVMSILYSTRAETLGPIYSALIVYRPQE